MPHTVNCVRALRALLGLVLAASVSACFNQHVTTGAQAAARFVYHGEAIQPMCVNFSLERLSVKPNRLASCTGRTQVTTDERGWLASDFPPSDGRGNISYRVLAAKGDRFLIAVDTWGGGTGQFSSLLWVRLQDNQVIDDRDVRGGDRCAGGLTNFTADTTGVRFNVSTTSRAILKLAEVALSDSVLDGVRDAYWACDGDATYVYDPASEKMQFASLTLNSGERPMISASGVPAPRDLQTCFDSLARRHIDAHEQTLSAAGLKAFGRDFTERCAAHTARQR